MSARENSRVRTFVLFVAFCKGLIAGCLTRFMVEHGQCAIIYGLCVFVRVANRGQPHSSQFSQCAHHVEHHTCLARLIEMEVVPHDNIKQIVWSERPILRRLNVVAGDKKLLLSVWGREDRCVGIVGAVGEKLQRQKWMGGPAFSQIDLDGVWFPSNANRPITPSFASRLPTLVASRVIKGA